MSLSIAVTPPAVVPPPTLLPPVGGSGPLGDRRRLAAVERSGLLRSTVGEALDRLTRLAGRTLGVEGALLNVITADEQVTASCWGPSAGVAGQRCPVADSFCQHEVRTGAPFVVEDAREHPLVRESVWTRDRGLVAYAGVPVTTPDGQVLGSFCVIDGAPRAWTPAELQVLRDLAAAVVAELGWRAEAVARDAALREARAAVAARDAALADAQRARAGAEQASRAKSAFLATMSHELRTPLNAIVGHVQLVELGVHGPVTPAQAQALGRVQQAQARLLALVDDVLDFARLEAGHLAYSILPVPLAAVIADVTALVEPQVRARGLVLEVAPPDGHAGDGCSAALVSADRERLGQVLLNLVSNALKFTPPRRADGTPGRITVGMATRDEVPELIFLRVEDTGIGIPRHRQAAIFDPFVQAETGHTRPHDGVGLGLAISRDLARGMGGDLRVRSVPGEGTTFTVTLRRVLPAD